MTGKEFAVPDPCLYRTFIVLLSYISIDFRPQGFGSGIWLRDSAQGFCLGT